MPMSANTMQPPTGVLPFTAHPYSSHQPYVHVYHPERVQAEISESNYSTVQTNTGDAAGSGTPTGSCENLSDRTASPQTHKDFITSR